MSGTYDDIINLPHHVSSTRPHMSSIDRAAQFSPFAALTGFGAAITETGRLTEVKRELSEETKAYLSEMLNLIQGMIANQPQVSITFFEPDNMKSGGKYVTASGFIIRIDEHARMVVMGDGITIPIEAISEIEL